MTLGHTRAHHLGPLRALAGVWEGTRGLDVKPKADGRQTQTYVERIAEPTPNPRAR